MTERHSLTIKEPPGIHQAWATLIARAADNISRIVQSEINLFEASFWSALEGHLNYALAGLAMLAAMICGTLCALAALAVGHKPCRHEKDERRRDGHRVVA